MSGFRVVFARSSSVLASEGDALLAIVPHTTTWNDFGLKFFANLVLVSGGKTWKSFIGLMFEDETDSSDFLRRRLKELGPVVGLDEIGKSFCTLFREAEDYRSLVEEIGFAAALPVLRDMHDVVLARLENEESEALRLSNTTTFHLGMLRNAEQYAALRRGGRYLTPVRRSAPVDAARPFGIAARLSAAPKSPYVLKFDFEDDALFRDRACVVIGRNGVGKTQLLRAIVDGMTDAEHRPPFGSTRKVRLLPRPHVGRVLLFSSVTSDPYPRAIPPWHGIDYAYFTLVADNQPLGRGFNSALVDALRDDGSLFGDAEDGTDRQKLLSEALKQMGFWSTLHIPLKSRVSAEFPSVIYVNDTPYLPIAKYRSDKRTTLLAHAVDLDRPAVVLDRRRAPRTLSSGELVMANFLVQAISSIENGSLLLFDEPETHLHPNYVSEFMDVLQDLLERTRSIAVIATHSAYIVREVPRRRVNILRRDEDLVQVDHPRAQTFGLNVDDISRFVFEDGSISHRYEKVLSAWAEEIGSSLSLDELYEQYGQELNPETLAFLARRIDPAKG